MSSRVVDPRRRWTLARVLSPSVTERTRAKGYSYYVTGTVTITTTTTKLVTASVRGTRVYHVSLARENGGFLGSCDCPFFADRYDICKHIWAVVLAADAQGLLPPEGPDAWLDVDVHILPPGGSPPSVTDAAAPRRPDPWERFLDGVLHQVAATESASVVVPRYVAGELLYVIDRDVTLQGDGVALTVLWRQRKKNGDWGKPQPAAVAHADIELLSDAVDREILSTLVGASDPYAGTYTTAYSRASFRLAGPITDRALWLLASSRRLYLRYGCRRSRRDASHHGRPRTAVDVPAGADRRAGGAPAAVGIPRPRRRADGRP